MHLSEIDCSVIRHELLGADPLRVLVALMKRILTADNVDVLAQFAWARGLVAFDFDGTLAPLVGDRQQSRMRPRTHGLLEQTAKLYPCAIIANRTRADVLSRLDGIQVKHVVGNHGIEAAISKESFEQEMASVLLQLESALRNQQGVDVENKRHSIAIHYHRARRKAEARVAIVDAIAGTAPNLRIIPGKLVLNVTPTNAPNKGDALVALREREDVDIALYVGDDVSDEDVFQLDQPGRLLCIRVGFSRKSAAPWYLRNQQEMDLLLETLVDLRAKGRQP